MSNFAHFSSVVDAANAHIDELITAGLATEADKSPTIEGALNNIYHIYAEQFQETPTDDANYAHTAADQLFRVLEVVGKSFTNETTDDDTDGGDNG